MYNELLCQLREIWAETSYYWNDNQSALYYSNCIVALMECISQLAQNNVEIENACANAELRNSSIYY